MKLKINTDNVKEESGAIIIEGVLFLSIFLFLFMTFYSVVNLCTTEAKVNHALCGAAKDISEFSYILAFVDVKATMENAGHSVEGFRQEIGTNVIGNVEGIMDGLSSLGGTSTPGTTSDSFIEGVKQRYEQVKDGVEQSKEQGKDLFNYLKSNFSSKENAKAFFVNAVKLFAFDGYQILKNFLGQLLAKNFCEKYMTSEKDLELLESIDFSKTMIFPNESDEIILVAEYKVKVAPFLPVDIEYTVSQQAITLGWLYGDRNNKTSIKGKKPEGSGSNNTSNESKKEKLKAANTTWNSEDHDAITKYMRKLEEESLFSQGYYYIDKDSSSKMYNPSTNEILYVGTSNPLYGLDSMDDYNSEDVKNNLLRMTGNVKAAGTSTMTYKEVDKDGNIKKETVNAQEKGAFKRKILLLVPEDEGLADKIREDWNSIPEEQRQGVVLDVIPAYGSYFEEPVTGSDGSSEEN